jgi:chaperone modulatory protein CbpM
MSTAGIKIGPIIEEEIPLTLAELCQACGATEEYVIAWAFEGVLDPIGRAPQEWLFTGQALRRARLALRLTRDLEVNPPGVALVLDLLDQIAELQGHLLRVGGRWQGR